MRQKRFVAILLSICLLLTLAPLTAFADPEDPVTVVASGSLNSYVNWRFTSDGVLTLSGSGPMPGYFYHPESAPYYEYKGDINTLVLNEGITTIGSRAFTGWSNLTGNLVIPDSVTEIQREAFNACTGLNGTLTLGSENSHLKIIMGSAFRNCKSLTGDLVIPDSVTSIEGEAFFNCYGLNGTLTLGSENSRLQTIGYRAFNNCNKLTGSLVIPDSMTSIGNEAFSGCSGLNGALILGSENSHLQTIQHSAFKNCTNLTGTPIIPSGVTTIEHSTFFKCSHLTGNLVIPDGVTSIGDNAFIGCSGFNGTLTLGSENSQLQTIGQAAFKDCTGFTGNLVVPDSVTSIASEAFSNCAGLNGTLTLGSENSHLKTIGYRAFYICKNLTENLVIPDSMTSIGTGAFSGCTGLNGTLTLGSENSQLQTIGSNAFFSCSSLTGGIVIPDSVTSIGDNAFYSCTGLNGTLTLGSENSHLQTVGYRAFMSCGKLTGGLVFPDSVTRIGGQSFYSCKGLNGAVMLGSENSQLQVIGAGAFQDCSNLTGSITIPDSVTVIENRAFYACYSLNGTLTLGSENSRLQNIQYDAFNSCGNLRGSLKIPDSVTAIGHDAFKNCSSLNGTLTLGSENSQLQTIAKQAFYNCKNLTGGLTVPDSVQTIGESAFNGCSKLNGPLTLGSENSSLTTIGASAFYNCVNLTGTMKIPESVTEENVGTCAFHACAKNTNILTFFALHPDYIEAIETNRIPPTVTADGKITYKVNCNDPSHTTAAQKFITNIDVPVSYIFITGLTVSPVETTLAVEQTETINVTFNTDAMDQTLVFTSGDPSVATVDENGVIRAVAPGTTTVTVTPGVVDPNAAEEVKATVAVTVYDLTVPEKIVLTLHETASAAAEVTPAGASTPACGYTSSDTGVFTVDAAGNITPVAPGSATLTVTDGVITKQIPVSIADAQITVSETMLKKGEGTGITVTALPAGTLQGVTYTVSDPSVLSVSDAGEVTSLENGESNVTVVATLLVDGETVTISETFLFSVYTIYMTELAAAPTETTLAVDQTEPITVTFNTDAMDQALVFTSGDPTVATVDANSVITAVAPGTTTITVTPAVVDPNAAEEVKATVAVTVYDLTVPEKIVLTLHDTASAAAEVTPAGASTPACGYTSSDTGVFTVDDAGNVTPVAPGSATLTVTDGVITKQIPVSIADAQITVSETMLKKGETAGITVTALPAGTLQDVTYTVYDPSVLSVSDAGEVTALKTGESDVTVVATLLVDSETVTIIETLSFSTFTPVTGITATADRYDLDMGEMPFAEITATVQPEDADNKAVRYVSSDPSVLTVDADGLVVALQKGTATVTITAADGFGAEKTLTFTVSNDMYVLQIDPSVAEGDFGTALLESDTEKPYTVRYLSSNQNILQIDERTGEYTVKGKGTVTVTAEITFEDGTHKTLKQEVVCRDPHEGEFRCKRCDWYDEVKDTPGIRGTIYWLIHTITHFVQMINAMT